MSVVVSVNGVTECIALMTTGLGWVCNEFYDQGLLVSGDGVHLAVWEERGVFHRS